MVRLIHEFKLTYPGGGIEQHVIWSVPRSARQPDGIRYRLVYILREDETPAVLYDNHHPKGHHKHLGPVQLPYDFVNVEKLIEDFQKDV